MAHVPPETRTYRVHARHVDAHHARMLQEPSFEAAAVAYVEDLHELPANTGELSIIVHDVESGHEHSFTVDLERGKISTDV
jgi:hypothetical protein